MLYHLAMWLMEKSPSLSWLNVLRYLSTRVVLAMMTALVLSFWVYPWFIEMMRRLRIQDVGREDAPETHQDKAGTPTMGGTVILLALVGSTLLWADLTNVSMSVLLGMTALFGVIGFVDDYLKIRDANSKGLPERVKFWSTVLVAALLMGAYFYLTDGMPEDVKFRLALPIIDVSKYPQLPGWLYVAFAAVVVVATSHAVNLTDGLDGLAIGPVIVNAFVFMVLAYAHGAQFYGHPIAEYLKIVHLPEAAELVIFTGAMAGAGIGFLWYNTYPASVFMGDVGALALGAAIGTLAVLTKNELTLVVVGGIFVMEAASVLIQRLYFKWTGGKRIFLMSPIHHHFEKKGWPEPRIIVRFWIISFILGLLGIISLKAH